MCVGTALTRRGESGLRELLCQPQAVGRDAIGLITIGDCAGGFRRAFDLLGVEVTMFGWLDVEERCSRVLGRQWPDGKALGETTDLQLSVLRRLASESCM